LKLTKETIYESDDDEIKYLSSETDENDDKHLWNTENEISFIMPLIA